MLLLYLRIPFAYDLIDSPLAAVTFKVSLAFTGIIWTF